MKRKLALLMAAVMSLTMLPTANVFAASSNSLSSQLNIVSKKSVVYESGVWRNNVIGGGNSGPITGTGVNADIDYGVNGTDLVIKVDANNDLAVGDIFRLTLDNATWFFRGQYDGNGSSNGARNVNAVGSAPFWLNQIASGTAGTTVGFLDWVRTDLAAATAATERWNLTTMNTALDANVSGGLTNTYDATLGAYNGPEGSISSKAGGSTDSGGRYGSYVRFAGATQPYDNLNTTTKIAANGDDIYHQFSDVAAYRATALGGRGYEVTSDNPDPAVATIVTGTYKFADADETVVAVYVAANSTAVYNSTIGTWRNLYDQYMKLMRGDYTSATDLAYLNALFLEAGFFNPDKNATANSFGSTSTSTYREVPYVMGIDRTENSATVVILPTVATQANGVYPRRNYWEIRVPLVIRTTGSGDVKVNIVSSTSAISNDTINLFSQTSSTTASTRAYIDDEYAISRNDFDLDRLVIQERRLYSIGNDRFTLAGAGLDNGAYRGTFTLRAPTGFEWKDPNALITSNGNVWDPENRIVNVGVEPGLYWEVTNAARFGANPVAPLGSTSGGKWSGFGYSGVYSSGTGLSGLYGNSSTVDRTTYTAPYSTDVNTANNAVTPHNDYRIYYLNQGLTTEDRSVLVVELYNITPSTDLMGKLYIEGLGLTAEDNAKIGDVLIEIRDDRTFAAGVTDEKSVKVGERREWDILFKTIGNIPTLVNGRYDKEDPLQSTTDAHQAARVRFEEYTINAWWSDRQTTFTLSEGAKFRMVDFYDSDKLQDTSDTALHTTRYTSTLNTTPSRENNIGGGVFVNDGVKHGPVTVNNDTITIDNIKISTKTVNGTLVRERAWIEMDLWISIQSGVTGDIKLACGGSAIPVQSSGGTIAPITIAKAVNPVNVTAKVTDVKIGYQYQPTYDIIITETAAGMLQKDKEVYVSVSDLISTDMYFAPETKVTPTAGNIKLKNINNTGAAATALAQNTTAIIGTGGTVSFTVDMASSIASTITLSNVAVKLDRTVPETNKYTYKVIAWGPAVAPNYTFYRYNSDVRDKFNTPGIMAEYIKVVSSADDKSSILSQEVRVTIGETYFTVNGTPYDMDAAAYISTASNSTMVPVRFISNAFGISDDQVIWDDANKTVTIAPPNRIVQFTAGSPTMLLNGTPVTMYSPDMLQVSAEIVGDRCYVPFRAMGEAFGVSIEWDAATQTAIYNPGAVTAAAAEAAAAETTATTAS